MSGKPGYHGRILEIDLSSGKSRTVTIAPEDLDRFVGGQGLGMKLLWDRLKKPGVDALSPENPLMFIPGPFSGLPVPSSSRTCVVTKSPITAPLKSDHRHASTVTYSNMGGFFGPEIRFAGYDGLVVVGKAKELSYIVIDDGKVAIRDARKFKGMRTDAFDKAFLEELGDRKYKTVYIGPAGENLVPYSSIIHTAGRAAGRGGSGCVMGSKNLKAIAVKGSGQPGVADHERFLAALEKARRALYGTTYAKSWAEQGTARAIVGNSNAGTESVRNYREGTFTEADKIGGDAARRDVWVRDFACYCCPLACKKSGVTKGKYGGVVHDGPEYETGVMLGSNLMISDMPGLLRAIYNIDDLGLDQISTGNVIGFLMEAYEKGMIDRQFLDGIDLKWGSVDATLAMIEKIAAKDGVGALAAQGVANLSRHIGQGSGKFAIHVKGLELAAHNIQGNQPRALSYVTASRGACHLSGDDIAMQNRRAMLDSTGMCFFPTFEPALEEPMLELLSAITGREYDKAAFEKAGERIFNLEKLFNYREGFRRGDDKLPDRFFEDAFTIGAKKGAVLDRRKFEDMLTKYYQERGWDPETTKPGPAKLKELGLDLV
ncbi:aldehyde ferredoxin oxidoreductase family protein [Geomonas nitrogeniifigens]|uniref:Aldehyde ferredoxin oxidoreductase family protein n=1 Tax=Geomonas diazotrophica TaxID=2843197 RepID=A0ABX8JIS1_9BACT|nr:aldehyde ferredoxin oxidoreductase family protein [Geomonas nitrogeniifigens]QWV97851.1 aldehyde ferredoxin oxidoreductase family protein [Geomonas nitrogeniifigens]QXE86991.1 aldehyde ferredoxin oxidoreductase family protein [Geomonas nitrogeniifigens]